MELTIHNFERYFEENEVKNQDGNPLEEGEFHKALLFDLGDKFLVCDGEACFEVYNKADPFELTMRRKKVKKENGYSIFIFPDSICRFPFEEIKADVPTEQIDFNEFFDRLHNKDRIWWNFNGLLEYLENAGLTNEAAALKAARDK